MDAQFLIPVLALVTLGAVCVFSLVSKHRTEQRRDDPQAPKSTLASDASDAK